jgi:acetyltransferase-like isoleucine patch superfamily enzyme
VEIDDHAYIGTGAILRDATHNQIKVGKGAIVGMGSVVTRSVEPEITVYGNPAKKKTSS